MNRKPKINKCATCQHFKSGQRELNYWDTTGFCVNDKFSFNTNDGRLIGVYDSENEKDITKVTGNPSHDIETLDFRHSIKKSRYKLQVTEDFGCIFHQLNLKLSK